MDIKSEKLFKRLSITIFVMYLILVVWVVMFKCNIMGNVVRSYHMLSEMTIIERILFEINPIGWYINPPVESQVPFYFLDDVLNVIVFVPFGLYLSYFIKDRKILKTIIIVFIISLSFEIVQLFTLLGGGSSKDIITNTLGAFIGCFVYKGIYKESRIKILNMLSIIAVAILIPIVIYAFVNTIINLDIYIGVLLRRI